jgi:EmrB/QacA subfamily drug resistance transporter
MTEARTAPDPHRWQALALVCSAMFMTILDVSIVNVALPSIGTDLHFSQESLQWVISAYAIAYGGFLLLSGRTADLVGRRRVFMSGLTLFTAASLVCGLATSEGMLIASRAVQGLGAAIIAPAALSIVMTTFAEGAERNKALGIWGAVGGSGAAVGVLAGGVLTKYLGWEWIFFVNVPVGVAALALTRPLVKESRVETTDRTYDPLGALTVTSGLALAVYAISKAPDVGWGTGRTIGLLIAAGALLATFVVWETHVHQPLVPFRIFRLRTLAAANSVGILLGAVIFASFFLLTLYVQQVLGYSALRTGLTFVATAGTAVVTAGIAQAIVTKIGPKLPMAFGLALMGGGMLWYTQIPVHGSFASALLPGYLLVGVGMPFAFIPVSIAALAGVEAREAGLASGLINTSQQIGGAVGVAVASTVFASHFRAELTGGATQPEALTSGFQTAFWVLVGLSVVAVVAALTLVRREELAGETAAAPVL